MASLSNVPMIEISDLRKSYGSSIALRGLNFSVPKGEIVGFLGPNGAGKSTTMRILTGYLPYEQGSVRVGGFEVSERSDETRKLIGYLPEANPLYEDMMVSEYLDFIADVRLIPKSKRKQDLERAVTQCGIREVYHKDIGQLSKGYRQRVGLAQAIIHRPQLLILDEPTSGLDPNQIIEIRHLIKEIGRETTVLMSTHILQEAQSTCQRILIINNGLLVADDTPDELAQSDAGSIYIEVMPKAAQIFNNEVICQRIMAIPGIMDLTAQEAGPGSHAFLVHYEKADPRADIFRVVVEQGLILLEMKRQRASLEEIFRRLTTQG